METPIENLKTTFLGNEQTGKTNIISRSIESKFDKNSQPTIGANYTVKTLALSAPERQVKFQIWDTGGQDRFHSLVPMYLRGAAVVVVVFSVTDRKSFDAVPNWTRVSHLAHAA